MMTTSFSALLNFNVFNSHVFTRLQAKQRNQLFGAKTNGPPMAQRGNAARPWAVWLSPIKILKRHLLHLKY